MSKKLIYTAIITTLISIILFLNCGDDPNGPENNPPTAVTLYEIEELTDTSLTLVWSMNHDDDFKAYKIYQDSTSEVGESSTLRKTINTKTDTSFTVTGLTEGETYYYKVFVEDEGGKTTGSNIVSSSPEAPPEPVSLIEFSEITDSSMTLTWSKSTEDNFSYYLILKSTASGVDISANRADSINNINDTSTTVTDLSPNSEYHFAIATVNTSDLYSISNEDSAYTRGVASHLVDSAKIVMDDENWTTAVELFNQALLRDTANVDALAGLAWSYGKLSKPDTSLLYADSALEQNSSNLEALACKAYILNIQENYEASNNYADSLLSIDSTWASNFVDLDSTDIFLLKAQNYYALGEFENSLEAVQRVNPDFSADVSTTEGRRALATEIERLGG